VFAGPASAVVPGGAVPGLEIGTNYDVRLAAVSASPSDVSAWTRNLGRRAVRRCPGEPGTARRPRSLLVSPRDDTTGPTF